MLENIRVVSNHGPNNGKELDPKNQNKIELKLSKHEVNAGKAKVLFQKMKAAK